MKTHKHLYEKVCSFENLHAAAVKALRGKRRKRPGSAFFGEMEHQLPALREELLSGTYRHGGYTYFPIHEPKPNHRGDQGLARQTRPAGPQRF